MQSWQRLLYIHQPYPDNYTPETFLQNATLLVPPLSRRSFSTLSLSTTLHVVHRIAVLAAVIAMFNILKNNNNNNNNNSDSDMCGILLLIGDTIMLSAGAVIHKMLSRQKEGTQYGRIGLMALVLLALTPILATLTKNYSSDTIWALAALFSGTHLCTDYGEERSGIAVTSGCFLSIMLASRLSVSSNVYGFVLFTMMMFAGMPWMHDLLVKCAPKKCQTIVLVECGVTLQMLYDTNKPLALVFAAFVAFIGLVVPSILVYTARYVRVIRGPWDYDTTKEDAQTD